MAGIASYEQFLVILKGLYSSKMYSDVQIEITEEWVSHVQRDWDSNSNLLPATSYASESERDDFTPITIIDAHALILHVNIIFFEKQLVNHKRGESSKLQITVKGGQAKYMKIIIDSFYDEKVLHGLNEIDLLQVLELSKTYCNGEFVKNVLKVLEEKEVNVDIYNAILTSIWTLENSNQVNEKIMSKCKSKYVNYLAKLFHPIEEKYSEHRKFLEMEYASLLYLLQGDEVLAISENSLLEFVVLWLRHDSTRQTASIIEELLGSIRTKFLSFDFLFSAIKIDNITLNKWDGFSNWFVHSLGALGMSDSMKQHQYPNIYNQISRNTEHGIYRWYQDATHTKLNACRWLVQMTPEKPGEKFGPTNHLLVHDGFQFSPKLINITPNEGDESIFNMNLSISCSGSLADVRFVVGIVPADRDYDITSNKHFSSKFAQHFLKLTEPLIFKSDVQIIDFWTIDKDYIDHVNEHGMYVLMLPLTDKEYHQLSNVKLLCDSGHMGSLTINNKCNWRSNRGRDGNIPCTNYSLSQLAKIHLTSSCNYSL